MIGPHFELNPRQRPVQDLHWGICVCLPCFFLPLLTTQAQLHRPVDSPWTADEKLWQHILGLLCPQLISKMMSFLFFLSIYTWETIGQRGDGEWGGKIVREGERRRGNAESQRRSDWEGGEASELLAVLFSKHTAESPQLIHGFCF